MYMGILPVYMYVYYVHAWCPQRPEEGTRAPGTGVKDGCVLPCGYWELDLHPLEE